jgi:hypothetical protein
MNTLDVFRSARGELTVIMTGQTSPPTVIDRDTGASVTLEPAVLDNHPLSTTIVSAWGRPGNAWMGTLPSTPGASAVRLEIDVDGYRQRCVVHWLEAAQQGPMQ